MRRLDWLAAIAKTPPKSHHYFEDPMKLGDLGAAMWEFQRPGHEALGRAIEQRLSQPFPAGWEPMGHIPEGYVPDTFRRNTKAALTDLHLQELQPIIRAQKKQNEFEFHNERHGVPQRHVTGLVPDPRRKYGAIHLTDLRPHIDAAGKAVADMVKAYEGASIRQTHNPLEESMTKFESTGGRTIAIQESTMGPDGGAFVQVAKPHGIQIGGWLNKADVPAAAHALLKHSGHPDAYVDDDGDYRVDTGEYGHEFEFAVIPDSDEQAEERLATAIAHLAAYNRWQAGKPARDVAAKKAEEEAAAKADAEAKKAEEERTRNPKGLKVGDYVQSGWGPGRGAIIEDYGRQISGGDCNVAWDRGHSAGRECRTQLRSLTKIEPTPAPPANITVNVTVDPNMDTRAVVDQVFGQIKKHRGLYGHL